MSIKNRRDHLEKSSVSRRFLASLAGFEPTAFRLGAIKMDEIMKFWLKRLVPENTIFALNAWLFQFYSGSDKRPSVHSVLHEL